MRIVQLIFLEGFESLRISVLGIACLSHSNRGVNKSGMGECSLCFSAGVGCDGEDHSLLSGDGDTVGDDSSKEGEW